MDICIYFEKHLYRSTLEISNENSLLCILIQVWIFLPKKKKNQEKE